MPLIVNTAVKKEIKEVSREVKSSLSESRRGEKRVKKASGFTPPAPVAKQEVQEVLPPLVRDTSNLQRDGGRRVVKKSLPVVQKVDHTVSRETSTTQATSFSAKRRSSAEKETPLSFAMPTQNEVAVPPPPKPQKQRVERVEEIKQAKGTALVVDGKEKKVAKTSMYLLDMLTFDEE